MMIVAVCTAALVVVLSVFNGLENLLRTLYTTFDPQIKVEAAAGKSFEYTEELAQQLADTEGVAIITEVIEDYAYVRYRGADIVITLKGLSDNFLDQKRIDDAIVAGELRFHEGNVDYAIVGRGIQYALELNPNSDIYPLQVHYIKDVKTSTLDPSRLYSKKNILVGSVFAIEKNYDENYIFVPLEFARELLDYGNKRTSLEIKTDPDFSISDVKSALIEILGSDFQVLDNEEQHRDLYKLLNLEKVFVFIAFAFILGVGSINIFFALTMLALDKKKDIAVLYAMGANDRLIRPYIAGLFKF
jgi:lipoprotein-releasing system permease protein